MGKDIITITQLLGLQFFVEREQSENETLPINNTRIARTPSQRIESFTIAGETYPFANWARMLENMCNIIKDGVGEDVFADKVLNEPSFHRRTRYVFYENESDMNPALPRVKIGKVFLLQNWSKDNIREICSTLGRLFPDYRLTEHE